MNLPRELVVMPDRCPGVIGGRKPKMIGGGMVGLQATAIKMQLGPLLNGFVNYDFWLPIEKMNFPSVSEFMARYQARAQQEGVDPLGYYIAQ